MIFKNREEAAKKLLNELKTYKADHPVVLAVPRGAIKMAEIIAKGLEGDLSVILVHKIGAPGNDEFAIAAVGLSGHIDRQPYLKQLYISDEFLEARAQEQIKMLKARSENYGLKEPNYKGRTVIIVDDGIATGATLLSAIHEVKTYAPAKVVIAAPVAASSSAEIIRKEVDDLVVLHETENFYAVSQFFNSFEQVSDEEVVEILRNWGVPKK